MGGWVELQGGGGQPRAGKHSMVLARPLTRTDSDGLMRGGGGSGQARAAGKHSMARAGSAATWKEGWLQMAGV